MAQENQEDRTLPPSERRLEQAREDGNVGRSREIPGAVQVLVGASALAFGGPYFAEQFAALLRRGLSLGAAETFDTARMMARLSSVSLEALLLATPLLGAMLLIALAAPLATGGWVWSAKPLTLDPQRLDPIAGFGRMFSLHGLAELGKATIKSVSIGALAAWLAWVQREEFAALIAQPFSTAVFGAVWLLGKDALLFATVLALIAAIDLPVTIWEHRRQLRMTPDEMRREQKEMEGDPQLKARIRSLQRENARRRMMSEVPKADVVVTNPTHYAVALAYREGEMRAPRVVAKGQGEVAARIRAVAREHGVPMLEAPPLARALHRHVDLGQDVPHALYAAVAQVLAWVYQLRAAAGGRAPAPAAPGTLEVPQDMDPGPGPDVPEVVA
jgi:flagellar biosynthetic protein FlhB